MVDPAVGADGSIRRLALLLGLLFRPGFDLGQLPAKFVGGDDAARLECFDYAHHPLLVIGRALVGVGPHRLDVVTRFSISKDTLAHQQEHHGVHPLFPEGVVVLRPIDRSEVKAAKVMIAAHTSNLAGLPAAAYEYSGGSGGGIRTPDTRIMIPLL